MLLISLRRILSVRRQLFYYDGFCDIFFISLSFCALDGAAGRIYGTARERSEEIRVSLYDIGQFRTTILHVRNYCSRVVDKLPFAHRTLVPFHSL